MLGAVPHAGTVELTVWAPHARSLAVHTADGAHALDRGDGGMFTGEFPGGHGDEYVLALDGDATYPDPCSRWQPYGVRGPSAVVDVERFAGERLALCLDEAGFYEREGGTFTDEGTFHPAVPKLAPVRRLRVTALDL